MNKARPVEINGVIYPSNKAAAEALGISPSTLVRRIRAGLARYAMISQSDLSQRGRGDRRAQDDIALDASNT
jgi:hypothetical protein